MAEQSSWLNIPALLTYAALAAVVAQQAWRFWLRQHAATWPSTEGRVRFARIVRASGSLAQFAARFGDEDSERTETFKIEIAFDYEVAGRKYLGERYSLGGDEFDDYGEATDALHGIAAGAAVTVFYDPTRPQRAVVRL